MILFTNKWICKTSKLLGTKGRLLIARRYKKKNTANNMRFLSGLMKMFWSKMWIYLLFLLYVWGLCWHVCLCITCMPDVWRLEECVQSLKLDSWEPTCGCWKLNPSPLQDQPEFLTTEQSLQPHPYTLKKYFKKEIANFGEGRFFFFRTPRNF